MTGGGPPVSVTVTFAEDLTASELDRVRLHAMVVLVGNAELVRPDVGRLPDRAALPVDVGRSAERIDCALSIVEEPESASW